MKTKRVIPVTLDVIPVSLDVIPAKAGTHVDLKRWIPAFAGMTV
jgi:hypothetical protein